MRARSISVNRTYSTDDLHISSLLGTRQSVSVTLVDMTLIALFSFVNN